MAFSTMSLQFHMFPSEHLSKSIISRPKVKPRCRFSAKHSRIPHASISDLFVLQIAENLEDAFSTFSSPVPPPLQRLRDTSSQTLISMPWPTRKDEPFRFTDISFIRNSEIYPIMSPTNIPETHADLFVDTLSQNLVIVDGHIVSSLSNLSKLPNDVFVGGLSSLSSGSIMERVNKCLTNIEGDLFLSLNGVGAPDLILVYVPAGCHLEHPLHLRYYSIEGADVRSKNMPISNPRVLVVIEEGAKVDITEEYMAEDGQKCYWANSATEVVIGKGAKVSHSYIQSQSRSAAHTKWTAVQQESASSYKLVEVSTGGKLSRHNLHVQQVGPDTVTEISTLHLSVGDQTQDLHSRLILDHPRGYARQLHKCIVAHSLGQAVFDGNVKVNRYAQQTDAGQLTRSLLLEPRATVNVKPNLQIVADDVKCSHGAAISDLEDDQLFYFLARGISLETARKALVVSFGAEVIEHVPDSVIRKKVLSHIKALLESTFQSKGNS